MSRKFLTPVGLLASASDPTGTFSAGDTYYNTTSKTVKTYDGAAWVATSGGTKYTYSNTAPSSPSQGDIWTDSDTGIEYTWLDDGIGSPSGQWVELGASGYLGAQGIQGTQGTQGTMGIQGAGGSLAYYGAFQSNVTQTALATSTGYAMQYEVTDEANGISIALDGSSKYTQITFSHGGTYNIQFSAQVSTSNSSTQNVWVWLRKNGVDVADSNTRLTLSGSGQAAVAAWNWVFTAAANDYYQIMWAVDDTSMYLMHTASNAFSPAIPSVIMTVTQVMYTVQGTQGLQGTQGVQGTQGTQGVQGLTGSGSQGTQGTQGVQGTTGTGTQGTQGTQGPSGSSGSLQDVTITGSASSTTPLTVKGTAGQSVDFFKVIDSASATLINVTSAGTFNVSQGSIIPMAGTTTEAPIDLPSGSLLSAANQGSVEWDGNNLFITGDTTNGSGRMVVPAVQKYYLGTPASAIAAGTDFFPTGRPAMLSGHLYHFRFYLVFSKNTAGTVTFQFKNSAAANFTFISANMQIFVQGAVMAALGNIENAYAAGAATATFVASQSLANNANCVAVIDGYCVPAANTRLSITPSAYGAGTISTVASSNYIITDLGTAGTNYGNFG